MRLMAKTLGTAHIPKNPIQAMLTKNAVAKATHGYVLRNHPTTMFEHPSEPAGGGTVAGPLGVIRTVENLQSMNLQNHDEARRWRRKSKSNCGNE